MRKFKRVIENAVAGTFPLRQQAPVGIPQQSAQPRAQSVAPVAQVPATPATNIAQPQQPTQQAIQPQQSADTEQSIQQRFKNLAPDVKTKLMNFMFSEELKKKWADSDMTISEAADMSGIDGDTFRYHGPIDLKQTILAPSELPPYDSGEFMLMEAVDSAGNRQDGEYSEYDRYNNQLLFCNYANGLLNGKYTEFWLNGQVRVRCNFIDGKLNGEFVHLSSRGDEVLTCNYIDDKLDGECDLYYTDTAPAISCTYKQNVLDGDYRGYSPDELALRCSFINGKLNGDYIVFYEDGVYDIQTRGKYQNGRATGEWITYDRDGEIIDTKYYHDGEAGQAPTDIIEDINEEVIGPFDNNITDTTINDGRNRGVSRKGDQIRFADRQSFASGDNVTESDTEEPAIEEDLLDFVDEELQISTVAELGNSDSDNSIFGMKHVADPLAQDIIRDLEEVFNGVKPKAVSYAEDPELGRGVLYMSWKANIPEELLMDEVVKHGAVLADVYNGKFGDVFAKIIMPK